MNKIVIALGIIIIGGVVLFAFQGAEEVEEMNANESSQGSVVSEVDQNSMSNEDIAEEMNEGEVVEEGVAMDEAAYTLEDIAIHASAEDCWLSIDGRVFDVTAYIAEGIHPGGEAILNGCGLADATPLFEGIKEGEGHPEGARNYMEQYYIGVVSN